MGNMKTPGVYTVERNAFPDSVEEAPTAIPAFIGITKTAMNGSDSLEGKPWKIMSMTEFYHYFGGAPVPKFMLSVDAEHPQDAPALNVKKPDTIYTLYYNMQMFFANGGGTCYIVSVGRYENQDKIDTDKVDKALKALEKEPEVTLIIIPEAVNTADCKDIQQLAISHCGNMQNRFAIFDVQPKASDNETMEKQIETFRTNIGSDFLSYGAAYYPWLNTSILSDNDMNGDLISWDYTGDAPDLSPFFPGDSKVPAYMKTCFEEIKQRTQTADLSDYELLQLKNRLHNALLQNWPDYQLLVKKVKECLSMLPPSAAMAGIYTMVDNTRGVWKAPANISVNYVNSLTKMIDNKDQEDLNVPTNGKSINAIRTFNGEGIKVWGARTLDGNSLDWRYINVRRTMLFLETSVKNAARAYVFEPNDASTWIHIKCMIENFLRGIWKRGGLAGATPEEAFSVHVGLGDTMTPEDILEGIMRITALIAVSHPAEFIEITFQQQMQKR